MCDTITSYSDFMINETINTSKGFAIVNSKWVDKKGLVTYTITYL